MNRGSNAGEANTTAPTGVRDLQFHPPENGHLVVAAFKVPEAGALSFTATQSYSVFAWVNVPSLGNRPQGIVTKSWIVAPWYGIWASSANEWAYGSSAANILGPAVTSGWHFISLVQDASLNARYLYVDGVKVGEAGAAPANGPGNLYFGRADQFSNEYFEGTLDEINISNAARSGSWISAQYSSTQDQFITYSTDLPATASPPN